MAGRLGLDIDGVLVDFDWSARQTLVELGFEDPGPSETWDHIKDACPDGWDALFGEGIDKGLFHRKDAIYPGAKPFVQALKQQGWHVMLVTSRPDAAWEDTEWLCGVVDADSVVRVNEQADKVMANCDLYIDDSPLAAQALVDAGADVIIFDQPWNREIEGAFARAHDYHEVLEYTRMLVVDEGERTQEIPAVGGILPRGTVIGGKDERELYVPTKADRKTEPPDGPCASAQRLVYGDRQADYGHPLDDFSRTAALWSALFNHRFEPEDVALAMIALKLSRERNRHTPDNMVDAAGYAETHFLVLQEKARREASL